MYGNKCSRCDVTYISIDTVNTDLVIGNANPNNNKQIYGMRVLLLLNWGSIMQRMHATTLNASESPPPMRSKRRTTRHNTTICTLPSGSYTYRNILLFTSSLWSLSPCLHVSYSIGDNKIRADDCKIQTDKLCKIISLKHSDRYYYYRSCVVF